MRTLTVISDDPRRGSREVADDGGIRDIFFGSGHFLANGDQAGDHSATKVPRFILEVWNQLMMSFGPDFCQAGSDFWRRNSQTAGSSISFSARLLMTVQMVGSTDR